MASGGSVFYNSNNPGNQQRPEGAMQQQANVQGQGNVALPNQQQQVGVVDMKGDMQNLMSHIGAEAQVRMQQQLAQLIINKAYKTEEETRQKRLEEDNQNGGNDDGSENCSTLIFKRCCFFLDIDFYSPYFKGVTTSAVLKRIGYSIMPCKADFFSVADTQPDLYGPLWICFSLVFALTAAGNLALYILSPDKTHFTYKFSFVATAFNMVFGYCTIVPLFIAFMMKLFGSTHTFYLQTICIYGYSLFVFIPVSLLCAIPNTYLQYGLFIYAALNSMLFLLNNFLSKLNELKTQEGQTSRKSIVMLLIAGIQVLMMLLYKYYFFKTISFGSSSGGLFDDLESTNPFNPSIGHLTNSTMVNNGTIFKQLHPHSSYDSSLFPNGLV